MSLRSSIISGSAYESGLNGAALSSLFPLAAPFLSSAGHLLGDPTGMGALAPSILPPSLQQSSTSASAPSSTSTPSLLSAAGSSSPIVVPVNLGESALQLAAKAAATGTSHGNNNNGGDATGGDSMH